LADKVAARVCQDEAEAFAEYVLCWLTGRDKIVGDEFFASKEKL